MKNIQKLQFAVDEKPPIAITVIQAFQHVITIYSSIVVVPIIIANVAGVPKDQLEYILFATLMVTAISTLIQATRIGKIGSGYIIFTGTSAAFISCSLSAAEVGGFSLVATMAILAAPLEFLFAYFLGFLRKVVTPVVGGVVIMLLAVTLVPISMSLWVGQPGLTTYQSSQNLLLGLSTFLLIAGISFFGKPSWRLWAPALGIFTGYIMAIFMGLIDFTAFKEASLIGIPAIKWPGLSFDFSPQFWSVLGAFAIVTIVGSIETVGDVMAIQRVSQRNFRKVDYDSVQGALYSDGIGNILAGLAGTVPNTSYSGNISIVELTGVASRQVGMLGAAIIGLLAFFPWLSALVMSIPESVLGASMFIFFAMLFVTGLKLALHTGLNNRNAFIVGISFWIGFIAENRLFFADFIPPEAEAFLSNGVAVGGITAFLLSLLFVLLPGKKQSLILKPELSEFNKLKDFIKEMANPFNINEKSLFQLQLLCEEVFVYLAGTIRDKNNRNHNIKFIFTSSEDGLLIEVQDRSETDDLDIANLPKNLTEADDEELSKLGLALLSKIAHEVIHIRISGVNYISFRLPQTD